MNSIVQSPKSQAVKNGEGSVKRLIHVTTVGMTLRFVAGQVRHMQRQGIEVHAMSAPGALLDEFHKSENVPIHAVEMTRKISPIRDLFSMFHIHQVMRRIRPDIVHGHTPKGGLLAMIAAWLGRVPVRIYQIHGLPFITARRHRRLLLKWSEKISCLLAHEVLCVSESMRQIAITEGICPESKVRVLCGGSSNGVDGTDQFNPNNFSNEQRLSVRAKYSIPADAILLGFIGRIVRDKGLIELVEAWQSLRDALPNMHLLVVGPFEPHDPLPSETERTLREDPRIHLAGENWSPAGLYSAMDMVVLPSYREGFPVVPLEAAAMGLPMIATRIPGCVDAVVDGVTGTLVEPHDAMSLAKVIERYASQAELRRAHGEAGRQRVLRDFRPEKIWEAVYSEYERLLNAKRNGHG
jgi:glycosyltransferase involved in cell wall biosynthesis